MTTTDRDLMTAGGKKVAHSLLVFDTDQNMFFVYDTIANPDRWIALNPWVSEGTDDPNITTVTTGNVGIGTTTAPTEKLEVNGNIKSTGNVSVTGDVSASTTTVTGTVTSGSVTTGNVNSSGTVTATTFVGNGTIPIGGIIMWSGTTPPAGWALCNGANGTPNLQGRFIVGYNPAVTDYNNPGNRSTGGAVNGNSGGQDYVTLNKTNLPPHTHNYSEGVYSVYGGTSVHGTADGGTGTTFFSHSNLTTGNGSTDGLVAAPFDNRSAYYVLAFIMRVQ
jgi:hypothetical protein